VLIEQSNLKRSSGLSKPYLTHGWSGNTLASHYSPHPASAVNHLCHNAAPKWRTGRCSEVWFSRPQL